MLFSDAKELYFNGLRVGSLHYGGNKIYPLSVSSDWLQTHTWSEIKAACKDGTISDHVNLGDTVTITLSRYGDVDFMVVGMNQALCASDATHGLILQATKAIGDDVQWGTSASTLYPSSTIANLANGSSYAYSVYYNLPTEVKEAIAQTKFYYPTNSKGSSQTNAFVFVPSAYELGLSLQYPDLYNTFATNYSNNDIIFDYYVDHNFLVEDGIWTRDVDPSTYRDKGCYHKNSGFGVSTYINAWYKVLPCFCI